MQWLKGGLRSNFTQLSGICSVQKDLIHPVISKSSRCGISRSSAAVAAATGMVATEHEQEQVSAVPTDTAVPPNLKLDWVVHRSARATQQYHQQKIVDVLQSLFPEIYTSVSAAKRACRRQEVYLSGSPADTTMTVMTGDWIQLACRAAPARKASTSSASDNTSMPGLDVIYEDEHIAVVFKPSGIKTQGSGINTVAGRIRYCLTPTSQLGALRHPLPCHRLDLATCGLVLVAKTRAAHSAASRAFEMRQVKKRYLAIVKGQVGVPQGVINSPIQLKPSVTEYAVTQVTQSKQFGRLTTLSLWPLTGRKHQLRRHCAQVLGTAMLGDPRYASIAAGLPERVQPCSSPGQGFHSSPDDIVGHHTDALAVDGNEPIASLPKRQKVHLTSDQRDSNAESVQQLCDGDALDVALPDDDDGEEDENCQDNDQTDMTQDRSARRDMLADGTAALLCLCAAELSFTHFITGQAMHVATPEPDYFAAYRDSEAATC